MKYSLKEYIIFFIILTVAGLLYDRYKLKSQLDEELQQYDMIQKFLLNDSSLARSKKPIIWIHLGFYKNSRYWSSFFSRNTYELNQPYLHLTIKSIIDKCGESFNVCLIDDDSFTKLIPGWSININSLATPIKEHIRQLAITKILYNYGGMLVPGSFACFKNLEEIYSESLQNHDAFVFQNVSHNSTSSMVNFFPNCNFMGCKKKSAVMENMVQYLEHLNSRDFTSESDFLGNVNRWLYQKSTLGEINLLDAGKIGCKDVNNKPILVDDLMSTTYLKLCRDVCGIYIPADEILRRTKYEWFARLSPKQVLECDAVICKHILLSNS